MSKTLAEQLARFGFKSKSDAIAAPEGFDEEAANAPVAEAQVKEVSSTEAPAEEVKAEEAPKTEVEEVVEAEAEIAEDAKAEVAEAEAPRTESASVKNLRNILLESIAKVVEDEAPKTESTSVKKSPKSMSGMRILDKDIDVDITSVGEVKPISNRGLRKFRDDNFGRNPVKNVPDEYIIDGVLGKGTGIPCVWEEGGADMASGYALLIADKLGGKKAPVLCLHDKDVSNGKHALVPVREGDLILLGATEQFVEPMCVTIGSVTHIDPAAKKDRIQVTISPTVFVEVNSDNSDFNIQCIDEELSFIGVGHPLLEAGLVRMQEKFCHEPAYVRDYVPYKFNKIINDDLNRTFADTKFVQTLQVFNDTNEAYDALEQVIGDKVAAATKRESVLVTTILNINKDSQNNNCVFIYIVGCVFNNAKEVCSSQGGRFFYARVKVLPGETFTYIDARDKSLSFEQALAQMTLAGKKWVADTVKRVTV